VDLTYSEEDQSFRAEVRGWLEEHLTGERAALKGLGGAGRDHEAHEERVAWNRLLAEHGWTCLGWPTEHGGRGLSLAQQVIFHEEYARADAPGRVNHLGEELLGPTLIAYGTPEQKARFLPRSTSCGRRATPSPTPAPTSRTCRPRHAGMATTG
jgi:alkylation response protein AidB-like acyl-CoA dehydrogenase